MSNHLCICTYIPSCRVLNDLFTNFSITESTALNSLGKDLKIKSALTSNDVTNATNVK